MAINKNFVVKNGLEVSTNLIFADADNRRVGVLATQPIHSLHVNGGIGATDLVVTGVSTFSGISTFSDNVYVAGISTVDGGVSTGVTALTIIGDLRVTGDISLEEDATLQDLNVTGIATINNLYTSGGNLVAGIATVTDLDVTDIVVSGGASFSGITTINNLAAGVATEFYAATGIQSGGVVIGTGVTTINFTGVGATLVEVDGTTANVFVSGGPGISSVGIQSGGEFVGYGTIINFYGDGILNASVDSNQVAQINVGVSTLGYRTQVYNVSVPTRTFPFTGGYNVNAIEVYFNGSKLINGSDFTAIDESTVDLLFDATSGDVVELLTYSAPVGAVLGGYSLRRNFVATQGQTVFTFNGGYLVGDLDVYYNGSKLVANTDYIANDGSTFILIDAADQNDQIEAVAIQKPVVSAGGSYVNLLDDGAQIGLANNLDFGNGLAVTSFNANAGFATIGLTTDINAPGSLTVGSFLDVGGNATFAGILTVGTFSQDNISTPGDANISGNANISGVTTMGNVIVGGATTDLLVNGDARITGILTIGTSSITLDPNDDSIRAASFVGTGSSTVFTNVSISSTDVTYIGAGAGSSERTASSKFNDIVSVKDFGAVGDGVTDDLQAFIAARNYAQTNDLLQLLIPPGNYHLSDSWSAPNGGNFNPCSIMGYGATVDNTVILRNGVSCHGLTVANSPDCGFVILRGQGAYHSNLVSRSAGAHGFYFGIFSRQKLTVDDASGFTVGDTVTGSISGTTGEITSIDGNVLNVVKINLGAETGRYSVSETIDGTSVTITDVQFPYGSNYQVTRSTFNACIANGCGGYGWYWDGSATANRSWFNANSVISAAAVGNSKGMIVEGFSGAPGGGSQHNYNTFVNNNCENNTGISFSDNTGRQNTYLGGHYVDRENGVCFIASDLYNFMLGGRLVGDSTFSGPIQIANVAAGYPNSGIKGALSDLQTVETGKLTVDNVFHRGDFSRVPSSYITYTNAPDDRSGHQLAIDLSDLVWSGGNRIQLKIRLHTVRNLSGGTTQQGLLEFTMIGSYESSGSSFGWQSSTPLEMRTSLNSATGDADGIVTINFDTSEICFNVRSFIEYENLSNRELT